MQGDGSLSYFYSLFTSDIHLFLPDICDVSGTGTLQVIVLVMIHV
jgi:hypothetical protein